MVPPRPLRAKRLPFGLSRRMMRPQSTKAAKCRRSVAGGHAVGAQGELLVGRERRSGPRRSAWSRDGSSATRREPPTRARTRRSWPWRVQIARNTCHLCTALSGGRAFAVAWLATWASVSDRRPKGVVATVYRLICHSSGKRNLLAKTTPTLDSDSGKWSSLSRHTERRGFRTETFGGLFLLRAMLLLIGLRDLSFRRLRRRKSGTPRITQAGGQLGIGRRRSLYVSPASLSRRARRHEFLRSPGRWGP